MKHLLFFLIVFLPVFSMQAQWQKTTYTGYVNAIAVTGNNIFAATNDGIFRSQDNGGSWIGKNDGITFPYPLSLGINGSDIYVGSYEIYISHNMGDIWTPDGFSGTFIISFAFEGNNVFAGTDGSGLFLTQNNGSTWNQLQNGLPTTTVKALAISGNNIFAGTYYGMFRSQDNGSSWVPLNNGFPVIPVNTLLIRGNRIYAGTYYGGFVYLSTDNGGSWVVSNIGLPPNTDVNSFVSIGTAILAGTGNSVVVSADSGYTWSPFTEGMPPEINVLTLAVNDHYVLAGTDNGIWRYPLSTFGIDGKNSGGPFSVYPNPANDKVSVLISDKPVNIVSVSILNNKGQQVLYSTHTIKVPIVLDIKNYPKGIYLLKIQSETNIETRKLVIQ